MPGQGTRSHMLQLRVRMLQLEIHTLQRRLKTPHATTKAQCSQINKCHKKRGMAWNSLGLWPLSTRKR